MSPAAWGLDAHNIIIAGTNERDMRVALEAIKAKQGGVVVADGGKVVAMIELPVAGLLSDKPAREVQAETILLKKAWEALNCSLPYMGFNLIPLSVIPELRITDMGLVHVTGMKVIPLFE